MHDRKLCDEIDCVKCCWYNPLAHVHCKKVADQWFEFGDVPMNPETECIERDWNDFPAGTHREEIWSWFEETYNVRVADLMYL